MFKKSYYLICTIVIAGSYSCSSLPQVDTGSAPLSYSNVTVHDPSIMDDGNGTYYVVGSHMAAAKTTDFINWSQISTNVGNQKFFKDIQSELGYAMGWGHTRTFWAGCFIKLQSGPYAGKYMMNYCVCQGSCPQAALGYAIADSPEGPYEDKGILLYSFGTRQTSDTFNQATLDALRAGESGNPEVYADITAPDGKTVSYNSNVMPNAIDPCTFYDEDGQLWMVYGSYSGGIFIHKLNEDGSIDFTWNSDYYGKRIMGNYHTPIEGPFIMYNPDNGYYYLFTSYGGLNARGGYNIRVARSETPDGPYLDPAGNDMIECRGVVGQTMGRQNAAIEKYGLKLMGNFEFKPSGNETNSSEVYMSPGHNSAFYDAQTGKCFLIFHTRFKETGDMFEVRDHEMFFNEDGWPVVAPHRYSGDIEGVKLSKSNVKGDYKFINHGTRTTGEIEVSTILSLNDDMTVSGYGNGSWKLGKNGFITVVLDGNTYKGKVHYQYDPANNVNRVTFAACGENNVTIWGSKVL